MPALPLVQYVVVRRDLDWPVGALIAQGCHVVCLVNHQYRDHPETLEYCNQGEHMHKVVLGAASQEQLEAVHEKLTQNSIDHALWIEHPEEIPTALALRPAPKDHVKKFLAALKPF